MSCTLPTRENIIKTEDTLEKLFINEGFNNTQTKKLTNLLLNQIQTKGGGCADNDQRSTARYFMVVLSGLFTYIIQEIISLIKIVLASENTVKNDTAFKKIVDNNFVNIKAKIYSLIFSTEIAVNKLNEIERKKYESYKSGVNVISVKINNLLSSTSDILKSVAVYCLSLIYTLLGTRGLDFSLENVRKITKEIIDNIFNNLDSLINLTAENIKDGYVNYVEGKESSISIILQPIEDWICNWLYKSTGGRKLKKRKTHNNKRKYKKTFKLYNK